MKYLNKLGFKKEDVLKMETDIPENLKKELEESNELVTENINFLKELGVINYCEIFMAYYEMFLMDNSNFKNVFLKYDRADLVDKLAKNITIIEHL